MDVLRLALFVVIAFLSAVFGGLFGPVWTILYLTPGPDGDGVALAPTDASRRGS